MARPLKDETDMIISYIRENTKDTKNWVSIGSRDVPKLFNVSQIYTVKLLEAVKEHPHILYEVDEHFASRFKPYHFRWVNDEQEKIDHGLTAKQFFWLNEKEVQFIKDTSSLDTYAKISKILKLCNLLAGDGAKKWWTPIKVSDLADLTVTTVEDTEQRLDFLISKQILVKARAYNNFYHLALDPDTLSKVLEESVQKTVRIKPKLERKKRKNVETESILAKTEDYQIKFKESGENTNKSLDRDDSPIVQSTLEKPTDSQNCLIESFQKQPINMHGLQTNSVITNAQTIKHSISDTLVLLQKHVEELQQLQVDEEATRRSYEAFMKLGTEYDNMRSEYEQTKENLRNHKIKIQQYEHEVKLLCEYNEAVLINAQGRMDILLGVISGLLDEYVMRPKFEKSEALINARLKKSIWKAVEDASDEIINFKPEDKFPPNLK